MSVLTPQPSLMAGMTMPNAQINYQQPPGLMDRFSSFAQNNPNQLALALGMLGESLNPTPTARAITQTARGKIMQDSLAEGRARQDKQNSTYMKMLVDAMGGKFTEKGVDGPTKLGITNDGTGSRLNLDFNLGNNGNTGGPTFSLGGLMANPAGPSGGPGAGVLNRPAYGGNAVNPSWPRLWNQMQ